MFSGLAVLLGLVFAPVATADPLTDRVDAPGVGVVKMMHAMQTCLADEPVGDVTAASGNYRETAFQGIAAGLLAADPETRAAYWKYYDNADWPTRAIETTYLGEIPWVSPGVVGSCQATGLYFVRKGLEIAAACRDDKAECRELFFEGEQEVVKEALKIKDDGVGQDKLFVYLASRQDELETWKDPRPFLEKACKYPETAMANGLFVDPSDLMAARWACLQQLVLITRSELAPFEMRCETPWADVSNDAKHVATDTSTDLGLNDPVLVQPASLIRRLYRMDSSIQACPGDWASNFRRNMLPLWKASQAVRACTDERLPPGDRAHLCPQMADTVAARLAVHFAAESPDALAKSRALLDIWAPVLGTEFAGSNATLLIDTAITTGQVELAESALAAFEAELGAEWVQEARLRLEPPAETQP